MGKGQELYKRAKQIIPGGTMLLSKRPEQFLPENWPAYYSRSKGCRIWDLDGKEYIDCSMMGIGTNTLGYANEEVDEAVMKVVCNGNLTTLKRRQGKIKLLFAAIMVGMIGMFLLIWVTVMRWLVICCQVFLLQVFLKDCVALLFLLGIIALKNCLIL